MSKSFYITTTLPYVNAEPHVGFALEIVQADVIARYKRLQGIEVFFNTGTDEHGQKIFQKAKESNRETQKYVDHYAEQFKKLKELFGLSIDRFIRTTDNDHIAAAQALWQRCLAKGDIYKKKYKGLYCVGDEVFIKDGDLIDGKCPNHPNIDLVEIEEENYFFRLSGYQKQLLGYLSGEGVIIPEWRRIEAIKFVEQGLEDFSISREKERMSWGVPVPGDENQVMYVWFDALTNYISTLGWPDDKEGNFKNFWQEGQVVQVAGKDQVRFQSIMWQAMLLSGDVKTTDKVVYHGFINSGGQKMSKSVGNVLSPFEIIESFKPSAGELATDVLRYYLLRHVNSFEDSDMTIDTVKDAYQANLANGLGNLVSRVMTLAEKYVNREEKDLAPYIESKYKESIEEFDLQKAMNIIWSNIANLDGYIQKEKPFSVIKEDEEKGRTLINNCVSQLWTIALMLQPFLPDTSKKIQELVEKNKKPEAPLFTRLS